MRVVPLMFYGPLFGTQKSMAAFISKYDLRKDQFQIKLGQKGQISKFNIFLQKHAYHIQFCLRIPKNVIYFYVRQLEMPKIAFQKSDVATFTFFNHCTVKNKDIALKFGRCVVCMQIYNIYSVFDNSKFLIYMHLFLANWSFYFQWLK